MNAETSALEHGVAEAKESIAAFQRSFARVRDASSSGSASSSSSSSSNAAVAELSAHRETLEARRAWIVAQLTPDMLRGIGVDAMLAVRQQHRARMQATIAAMEDDFSANAKTLRNKYDYGFGGLIDELSVQVAATSAVTLEQGDALQALDDAIVREQAANHALMPVTMMGSGSVVHTHSTCRADEVATLQQQLRTCWARDETNGTEEACAFLNRVDLALPFDPVALERYIALSKASPSFAGSSKYN